MAITTEWVAMAKWNSPRWLPIQDGHPSKVDPSKKAANPRWLPFQHGRHSNMAPTKLAAIPRWTPFQHGRHCSMAPIPRWTPFQGGHRLDLTLSTRCFLMTSSPVAPLLQLNLRGWDLLVATPSGGVAFWGGRGLLGGGVPSGAISDLFSLIIFFPVFLINFF